MQGAKRLLKNLRANVCPSAMTNDSQVYKSYLWNGLNTQSKTSKDAALWAVDTQAHERRRGLTADALGCRPIRLRADNDVTFPAGRTGTRLISGLGPLDWVNSYRAPTKTEIAGSRGHACSTMRNILEKVTSLQRGSERVDFDRKGEPWS